MPEFSVKKQWHNVYLILNALAWAAAIVFIATLYRPLFFKTGILMGICSMVSVVSCAVLIKPGKRLAGSILQALSWSVFFLLTIVIVRSSLIPALIIILPAGLVSLGTLALLGGLGYAQERQLKEAFRK
ncbi:hypothetical protein GX441_09120 [bacterium]|nr:hypothetical protein [bacterium]